MSVSPEVHVHVGYDESYHTACRVECMRILSAMDGIIHVPLLVQKCKLRWFSIRSSNCM